MTESKSNTPAHLTQRLLFNAGAYSSVLLCLSVAALGSAITTISSLLAAFCWLTSIKPLKLKFIGLKQPFILAGIILFCFIGLSLLWSENIQSGVITWKKYREFILIPVFVSFFSYPSIRKHALSALYFGMIISLITSYLEYFEIIQNPPRHLSIENHIFNGILISYLAYWSLELAEQNKNYRVWLTILFVLATINIFIIREGRTGYILFCILMTLWIIQHFKWRGVWVLISGLSLLSLVLYENYTLPLSNAVEFIVHADVSTIENFTSHDIRLEYYINTLKIISNHWQWGVGTGGFANEYAHTNLSYHHNWASTQNPHNEFLMITTETGALGLLLFLLFIILMFKEANKSNNKTTAHHRTAIPTTIFFACLFNSSFLDHSDGALFMVLISLFFSNEKPNPKISSERQFSSYTLNNNQ